MNWNNEGYVIEEHPLFKGAKILEQCNWPEGMLEYAKKPISLYAWLHEEDLCDCPHTVAIWRKKEAK